MASAYKVLGIMSFNSLGHYVLGPVPGVGIMAKGPQGWVQCEDRLPYYKVALAACHDPHDPATREDLGGGARGPGPARVGLLGLQCSARAARCSGQLRSK
jgi:hypothetical protein